MAFETAHGTFKTGTGTGDLTAITGFGFAPTAIIFYGSGRTEAGDAGGSATAQFGVGFGTSTTQRMAAGAAEEDAVATSNNGHIQTNIGCYAECSVTGGSLTGRVDIAAMGADGFTPTIDSAFSADRTVHFFAVGGDDLTNAFAGIEAVPNATGAWTSQDIGFQGDYIMVLAVGGSNATTQSSGRLKFSIGMATAAGSEWVAAIAADDAKATSVTGSYGFGGNGVMGVLDNVPTGMKERMSFTSFNAGNTFTLNVDEIGFAAGIMYLVLKGGQYHVGDSTTATDTSNFANTAPGFTPVGMMFASVCETEHTENVTSTDAELTFGAAAAVTARSAVAMSTQTALGTTEVYSAQQVDEVYINPDLADSHEGLMDLVSYDANGFTLVHSDADPSANFFGYVAFGSNAAASAAARGGLVDGGLVDNQLAGNSPLTGA